MKTTAPSRMSAEARLAELGDILAAAVQRISAQNIKSIDVCEQRPEQLDASANTMAPCAHPTEVTT